MSETETKTLAQMTAEVVENNTAKGWYENCATFPEAMALLHSEVSEALDAWRTWGLADNTAVLTYTDQATGQYALAKPEGVGSEFADIFIRLLDDAWLFGQIDLDAEDARRAGVGFAQGSFPANMNTLHDLISRVSAVGSMGDPIGEHFAAILIFLRQLCELYGIDLLAEYEKKMAFNRTRPYRHGDKRI
jgi:hypothetical protein